MCLFNLFHYSLSPPSKTPFLEVGLKRSATRRAGVGKSLVGSRRPLRSGLQPSPPRELCPKSLPFPRTNRLREPHLRASAPSAPPAAPPPARIVSGVPACATVPRAPPVLFPPLSSHPIKCRLDVLPVHPPRIPPAHYCTQLPYATGDALRNHGNFTFSSCWPFICKFPPNSAFFFFFF